MPIAGAIGYAQRFAFGNLGLQFVHKIKRITRPQARLSARSLQFLKVRPSAFKHPISRKAWLPILTQKRVSLVHLQISVRPNLANGIHADTYALLRLKRAQLKGEDAVANISNKAAICELRSKPQ